MLGRSSTRLVFIPALPITPSAHPFALVCLENFANEAEKRITSSHLKARSRRAALVCPICGRLLNSWSPTRAFHSGSCHIRFSSSGTVLLPSPAPRSLQHHRQAQGGLPSQLGPCFVVTNMSLPRCSLLAAVMKALSLLPAPKYTTAGTIYNPKAASSLQPPTRRPRARRYPQPIQAPSGGPFMPFPDALLSALPLEDQAPPSPPTTASVLQQYAPLQQNYDRAVSPTTEGDIALLAEYEMSMPSIRSGNLPSPTGYEGNSSTSAEETLTSRITVKGLTNLASYPNPMQKAAQNTLARARSANLDLSRPDTPSSLPSTTPDLPRDRLFNTYGGTTFAAGPPQPLKAGPPGQRPFKPTTLEAASRAVRIDDQIPPTAGRYQYRSPVGLPSSLDMNISAILGEDDGIGESGRPVQLSLDERQYGPVSRNPPGPTGFGSTSTPGQFDMPTEPMDGTKRKVQDTLPPGRLQQYFPGGFPSNYDGRHKPITEDWHTRQPAADDELMHETFSDRTTQINRNFYAGTEGLVRNMEQIVRDHNYRRLENKVGVIGGERERLRGSHTERQGADGKMQPPVLSVEEVNNMDDADAMRPLLNMAFATLLRYKEESESDGSVHDALPRSFIPAEDAWIDHTEEGNKSFFSEPKEDTPRKKKSSRKPRRGY
ncbi:hypothetical protein N657DRAFT_351041 [Parathielavia appendiculata]|uniref:Uncharacterized protein n=1 Tax=Parathielavia appendiculata TaxID=2587402 RepID=A0AAN6U271_9PEZI|nr:hypothetical protein N657DRAFT_351041 [Parathielavia appendiculata]